MIDAERARTVVLRERSRRTRLLAVETRTKSGLIHREAVRVRGTVRTSRAEEDARGHRGRLAGGSGAVGDTLPPFARDIARELTPPLCNLWLRVEVMLAELDAGQPSTDVAGDLSAINRLAAQLAAITKGLSCLAPDSALDVGPVDLNALLPEVLSPLIPRLARRGVAIRPNRGRAVPPILADIDALWYVVTSLVETVAETSPTVDLTTRPDDNGDVCLDVGAGRQPEAMSAIASGDAVRLILAEAIVRNFGGSVQRHIGSSGTAFTVSFRAVCAPSTGLRSAVVP